MAFRSDGHGEKSSGRSPRCSSWGKGRLTGVAELAPLVEAPRTVIFSKYRFDMLIETVFRGDRRDGESLLLLLQGASCQGADASFSDPTGPTLALPA